MLYTEDTVCNELRWEYGYTKKKALEIIDGYKSKGMYGLLCRLIEYRRSIA